MWRTISPGTQSCSCFLGTVKNIWMKHVKRTSTLCGFILFVKVLYWMCDSGLKKFYTNFSLIKFQENHMLLCKERVAYWHLKWRMTSHALSVWRYRASQFLCVGSRDNREFMLSTISTDWCDSMWLVFVSTVKTVPAVPVLVALLLEYQAVPKGPKREELHTLQSADCKQAKNCFFSVVV